MAEKVVTTIILRKEHHNWIKNNSINLSAWIRKKIDEEMKKEANTHEYP